MEFRDRLNVAIDELGISSYKISKNTHIPQSTLSNYRRNKNLTPNISIVKILAKYLDINHKWLLNGDGNMYNHNDGKNLEKVLRKQGLTISDAAQLLQVSEDEVTRLLSTKEMDGDLTNKIADILHIPERYITSPSTLEEETKYFECLLDERNKKNTSMRFMLEKIESLNRKIGHLEARILQLEEENNNLRHSK